MYVYVHRAKEFPIYAFGVLQYGDKWGVWSVVAADLQKYLRLCDVDLTASIRCGLVSWYARITAGDRI